MVLNRIILAGLVVVSLAVSTVCGQQPSVRLDYVLSLPKPVGAKLAKPSDDTLAMVAGANRYLTEKTGGWLFPKLNGSQPPVGSLVDLEIGGTAYALQSFGSAKVDMRAVQNGVMTTRFTFWGSPFNFELSLLLVGDAQNRVPGRAWIRVKAITPPSTLPELSVGGPLNVGAARRVYINRPADAGLVYWIAPTLSPTPGLPLPAPDTRLLPLSIDPLFLFAQRRNTVFTNFIGQLDDKGVSYDGAITIPSYEFVGFTFYIVCVTFAQGYPTGVKFISTPVRVTAAP